MKRPFASLYAHGFVRVAVCIPPVRVTAPAANLDATLELARQAGERGAAVALFPELGLAAYTCDDLFHQDALLDAAEAAAAGLVTASRELAPVVVVGCPVRLETRLYNCAVVAHRGRLLGVVAKSFLPNYREFYEKRYFAPADAAAADRVHFAGQEAPFGADLVFAATDLPDFALAVEICEDLWAPVPPSTWAALGGATVIANLSASNVTIGKSDFRRSLAGAHSSRCVAGYLFAASGPGESTTDLAWDGQALIYENGALLAAGERFAPAGELVTADLDLGRLRLERTRLTSFTDGAAAYRDRVRALRRVAFDLAPPEGEVSLDRAVDRFPFVPPAAEDLDRLCYEAYEIQVHGLAQRLRATGIEKIVLGVSGGLDSTQAAIVAAQTLDRLGLPRANLLGFSLPGFATSERTRANAGRLMAALGATAREIDIRPSCQQMLADLGHPAAAGEPVYDTTFENVQAGERTSHLFRLANFHGGLVLGTGDLSELALGWTTYGVGDQMAHYNVNGSVPKTLIQHLIRWVAASGRFDPATAAVLTSILDTAISPELVPGGDGDGPGQRTEDTVGPYDLQDFHLYHLTRYGLRPSKIAFLAHHAWGDRTRGAWPPGHPDDRRHEYDLATIKRWLAVFLRRFFAAQFKRSAMPNGPKVASGSSLSPRGDWRAPSDADPGVWLEELERNVPG